MDSISFSANTKGVPPGGPYSLSHFQSCGWNIIRQEVPFPVAILKQNALQNNSTVMRNYLATTGASIAPHGKTTMSPELFEQQINDGAWGLTAATTAHVQVYVEEGILRIFFANQLIGKQNTKHILTLLAEHPEIEFFCLIDSIVAVQQLSQAIQQQPQPKPINALIEVGVTGGRTGVRTQEQGLEIAEHLCTVPEVALVGVEAFEGIFGSRNTTENVISVQNLLGDVVALAETIHSRHLFDYDIPILSAGGSAYFDLVVAAFSQASFKVHTLLRSGCYLTQDHGLYKPLSQDIQERDPRLESFTPALEVWGCVQSRPEAELAIVNLGKRDISYDIHLPLPIYHADKTENVAFVEGVFETIKLNDQHAFIKIPADYSLEVGDLMGFGVSHPCTTFDKWRLLYVVTDDYTVVDAVHTCF